MHYYYFLMIFFLKNHAKSTTWPTQATACEHVFIFLKFNGADASEKKNDSSSALADNASSIHL
jgi:hypothetical protein